jgi:hypothetical protein
MGSPRCSRFWEQLVACDDGRDWRASGGAALIIMEILSVRVNRAAAPARRLVESLSTRRPRGSEHGRWAARDRVQILREAKNGQPIVEADGGQIPADGEDVALLSGAAEPLEDGAIAATDCDVAHVTGSTTQLQAATSERWRPPKGLAEVAHSRRSR